MANMHPSEAFHLGRMRKSECMRADHVNVLVLHAIGVHSHGSLVFRFMVQRK